MIASNFEFRGRAALVTGANGGLGAALVKELRERGCKVYAATRTGKGANFHDGDASVIHVQVDMADPQSIQALISQISDVTLIINNAGVNRNDGVLFCKNEAAAREEMEVNYFGPLSLIRALASQVTEQRDAAFINILSILAIDPIAECGTYAASKAAAHSLTRSVRAQLRPLGVRVIGVYPGPVDTPMSAHLSLPKISPDQVAGAVMTALLDGTEDLFPGEVAKTFVENFALLP